jgi:hypothetical protein
MTRVHVESIYGFYHGQDPRTFTPDSESCTEEEIANHKAAVETLERGENAHLTVPMARRVIKELQKFVDGDK